MIKCGVLKTYLSNFFRMPTLPIVLFLCRSLTRGSGQQCCYNEAGKIVVGPPGGGTADLVSSEVNRTKHFNVDVIPFLLCCKAIYFSNCGRYYEHRPSHNCDGYEPPQPPGM